MEKNTQQEKKMQETIYTALAKAHGEMTDPAKDTSGYNYQYATLDGVIKITRPILANNGLFVMQFPINEEDKIGVKTIVGHSSGDVIENQILMPLSDIVSKGNAAQQIGAVITYLRRYALMAVCGLAPEDDDAASLPEKKSAPRVTGANSPTASAKQVGMIEGLISKKGADKEALLKNYQVESLEKLNVTQASDAITLLLKKPDAKKKPSESQQIDYDDLELYVGGVRA